MQAIQAEVVTTFGRIAFHGMEGVGVRHGIEAYRTSSSLDGILALLLVVLGGHADAIGIVDGSIGAHFDISPPLPETTPPGFTLAPRRGKRGFDIATIRGGM